MAVFIGATKKPEKIFTFGKPYKVGKIWALDIIEIIDGKVHKATDYAYKKSTLLNAYKKAK